MRKEEKKKRKRKFWQNVGNNYSLGKMCWTSSPEATSFHSIARISSDLTMEWIDGRGEGS